MLAYCGKTADGVAT